MNLINSKCTDLTKHFESLQDGDMTIIGLQPKMCPAGIWTEGYGNAIIDPVTGKFLTGGENKGRASLLSDIYDEAGASAQLENNLIRYSAKALRVVNMLGMKFDDDKYSSLVSFTYNLGAGALKNMLTSYKNGMDINKVFLLYRFAKVEGVKTELPGLVRRRKAEAWLFTTGKVKFNF